MTEQQEAAVAIALNVLAGSNIAENAPHVKQTIDEAIAHRVLPPMKFKDKCVVVLHEAITRKGFFSDGEELVQR